MLKEKGVTLTKMLIKGYLRLSSRSRSVYNRIRAFDFRKRTDIYNAHYNAFYG